MTFPCLHCGENTYTDANDCGSCEQPCCTSACLEAHNEEQHNEEETA